MVVERGLARCPRCVSVADYVFIETAPGREFGRLRYEVHCRKCGERYGEDSLPQATVVAEPPMVWPPDRGPVEVRDWRDELRGRLAAVVKRGRSEIDVLARRTRSWIDDRRSGRKDDQTGG